MITYKTGNLFHSKAEALVNTVNCVGVMGKGIALAFKQLFPANYYAYKSRCNNDKIKIGEMFVYKESSRQAGIKLIINFPTKKHWMNPSQYSYIEQGLKALISTINEFQIKSIAIPALGCSNGNLDWKLVSPMIYTYLQDLDCDIEVYGPHTLSTNQ